MCRFLLLWVAALQKNTTFLMNPSSVRVNRAPLPARSISHVHVPPHGSPSSTTRTTCRIFGAVKTAKPGERRSARGVDAVMEKAADSGESVHAGDFLKGSGRAPCERQRE